MVNRRHAEELIKLPSLVDPERKDLVVAWNSVHAPEEVYFPTLLALLGFLRDDPNATHTVHRNSDENPFVKTTNDEVWRRRVCYAEWKKKNDANPVGFPGLTVSLCNHFRRHGSIFARKFGENTVPVSQWRNVIRDATPLSILKCERTGDARSNSGECLTNQNIKQVSQDTSSSQEITPTVHDSPPAKKVKSSHETTNEVNSPQSPPI